MPDYNIVLPSKPRVVVEEGFRGMYEIDGLYPGYGHTLGNSLRRIILSSIPGSAITTVSIEGVPHEFSTLSGVSEDVITILLNLKKVRLTLASDEPQKMTLTVKGAHRVTAAMIDAPGQVSILNPELHLLELTDKSARLSMTMTAERGLGYVSKEILERERLETGTIALDATFTPIRRVNYEVENMRVGDRTDFNRLKIFIETDGTLTPREALESSIETMIHQLKAIVGFKEDRPDAEEIASLMDREFTDEENKSSSLFHRSTDLDASEGEREMIDTDFLKTRIESLDGLSIRTVKALSHANIRTVGGLARKRERDILDIEGIGAKGLGEIKTVLARAGVTLK